MRFWDKTGNMVLDEPLNTLFAPVGGTFSDPYIEYDQNANRWYIASLSTASSSNVVLAISNDSNPLDGFSNIYSVPVTGGSTDFDKMGFNFDAIVLEANDFSVSGAPAKITVINKADALAGSLVFFQSTPSLQFRALVPAQMQGSKAGDPMWFMAATGDPTYDGTTPNTIRVTEMTNVLSSTPTYTDFAVSVDTYGPNNGAADQPGAARSVATNDVTTTQVTYLNGKLVTAFSAGTPSDGFSYTKAHYYEVDVSSGTPTLVQQGVIDPGPGVATFFPAATIDTSGNLGLSWMESSSTEYVSFWIGAVNAAGALSATDAAPGGGSMPFSFRAGDYGSVVLDPDGTTFWAANEYIGADGSSDIWRTKIASFTPGHNQDQDWYSFPATSGQNFTVTIGVPGSSSGGQFVNNLSPTIAVYDPNGNFVTSGTTSLTFMASTTGTYAVVVAGANNTQGEYILQVTDPPARPQGAVRAGGTSVAAAQPSGTAGGSRLAAPVLVGAARPTKAFAVASNLASGTRGTGYARDAGTGTLNVIYHPAPPAQENAASPGLIDLVLSQDNRVATSKDGSPDLITTLAEDILFGKKKAR
jgi:hypothetical protein